MKILYALFSYLVGSIPTGFILFYLREKKDIRGYGSQATGATNVLRLTGWGFGLIVLLADFVKGLFPVWLAVKIFQDHTFAAVCAFLVVVGHCFPVYIKFKGGKGVATTAGVYAVLALKPLVLSAIIFLPVVLLTRYMSLASLIAALFFPLWVYLLGGEMEIVGLSAALFLLVASRHRGNIGRLIKGTERKIGGKAR
ncbi:MAG: glycerol-3-phosphate 1-O-acyltransferase PlsY [Candidatus Aminicenantes bacterium]